MPIDFSFDRWATVKDNYDKWWAGELGRPIISYPLLGRPAGRDEPDLPFHHFTAFYDDDVTPEQIVDRWDYELCCQHFLGDGFPAIWPNFGPGVLAAICGCELNTTASTVWYRLAEQKSIDNISIKYDPENRWARRFKDIFRAAVERWEGLVQVGMTDLGGNLDVASSFLHEHLLTDLYDNPEHVERLAWEIHEAWWAAYEDLNSVLQPVNPGYSGWANSFSSDPYYVLQCDFCFMISPDMFERFVRPELKATCERLTNNIYHLDGPGQLAHLDSMLQIETLDCIQWVPGAGQPEGEHWLDVYRKILESGKKLQVFSTDLLDMCAEKIGHTDQIMTLSRDDITQEKQVHELLRRYGVK